MNKKILVPLGQYDRSEEMIPYIEKVVRPGMKVVFLVRYLVDGVWFHKEEHGMRAALEAKNLVNHYSWEGNLENANQQVAAACETLRAKGIEADIDVYAGSLKKAVRSHTLNGDVHLIMTRAGIGDSVRRYSSGQKKSWFKIPIQYDAAMCPRKTVAFASLRRLQMKTRSSCFVALFVFAIAITGDTTAVNAQLRRAPTTVSLAIGLPPRAGQCPGEYVTFMMDDEDDENRNYLMVRDTTGKWAGRNEGLCGAPLCYAGLCSLPPVQDHWSPCGQGQNTSYTFCKTTVARSGGLPTLYTDYFVLKLDSACPDGSKEFLRHWDNEDNENDNAQYGTAADGTPNYTTTDGTGHSELTFCWVRGTYNPGTPIIPDEWASQFALMIGSESGVPNGYNIVQGVQDDEDRRNENMYIFHGNWTTEEMGRVRDGLDKWSDSHNTRVRMLWK